MTWLALIVGGAATVVLAAVAASGIGPLSSLRRTVRKFTELEDELERLRRGLDRLNARRELD